MWGALATRPPSLPNRAQEKSSRSLMLTEWAVRSYAAPMVFGHAHEAAVEEFKRDGVGPPARARGGCWACGWRSLERRIRPSASSGRAACASPARPRSRVSPRTTTRRVRRAGWSGRPAETWPLLRGFLRGGVKGHQRDTRFGVIAARRADRARGRRIAGVAPRARPPTSTLPMTIARSGSIKPNSRAVDRLRRPPGSTGSADARSDRHRRVRAVRSGAASAARWRRPRRPGRRGPRPRPRSRPINADSGRLRPAPSASSGCSRSRLPQAGHLRLADAPG